MMKEGQVRIPSGCAIAAVISRDGKRMTGEKITDAMRPMHERSNGLGGGFAGYGIYPEYRDFYALHLFFDISSGVFAHRRKNKNKQDFDPLAKATNLALYPDRRGLLKCIFHLFR